MLRIGVDLGGTKIEIIALDEDGKALLRRRIFTPQGDYMGTVTAVARLIEQVEDDLGKRAMVGIGIPGTESLATGLIKNANSTCLIGRPLRRDLQTLLQRQIRLMNDANCFALSEAMDGAAVGADVVFGVILGTGVGGGVVIHGRPLVGQNAIAGEWGHNPLPLPTPSDLPLPACYCGRHGCIETYLSGPGLAADHAAHTGENISALEIDCKARSKNPSSEASLARYEERLARSLAQVINILDPDVIVLGGGLSNIQRLYATIPAIWKTWIFSDQVTTRLLPPIHGDSSGVRGAAWLWP